MFQIVSTSNQMEEIGESRTSPHCVIWFSNLSEDRLHYWAGGAQSKIINTIHLHHQSINYIKIWSNKEKEPICKYDLNMQQNQHLLKELQPIIKQQEHLGLSSFILFIHKITITPDYIFIYTLSNTIITIPQRLKSNYFGPINQSISNTCMKMKIIFTNPKSNPYEQHSMIQFNQQQHQQQQQQLNHQSNQTIHSIYVMEQIRPPIDSNIFIGRNMLKPDHCAYVLYQIGECISKIQFPSFQDRTSYEYAQNAHYTKLHTNTNEQYIMDEHLAQSLWTHIERYRITSSDLNLFFENNINTNINKHSISPQSFRDESFPFALIPIFRLHKYDEHHIDSPQTTDQSSNLQSCYINPDMRSLSNFILYANDDFEGGENSFYDDQGKLIYQFKPRMGTMIIYPSNLIHRIAPIAHLGKQIFLSGTIMYRRTARVIHVPPSLSRFSSNYSIFYPLILHNYQQALEERDYHSNINRYNKSHSNHVSQIQPQPPLSSDSPLKSLPKVLLYSVITFLSINDLFKSIKLSTWNSYYHEQMNSAELWRMLFKIEYGEILTKFIMNILQQFLPSNMDEIDHASVEINYRALCEYKLFHRIGAPNRFYRFVDVGSRGAKVMIPILSKNNHIQFIPAIGFWQNDNSPSEEEDDDDDNDGDDENINLYKNTNQLNESKPHSVSNPDEFLNDQDVSLESHQIFTKDHQPLVALDYLLKKPTIENQIQWNIHPYHYYWTNLPHINTRDSRISLVHTALFKLYIDDMYFESDIHIDGEQCTTDVWTIPAHAANDFAHRLQNEMGGNGNDLYYIDPTIATICGLGIHTGVVIDVGVFAITIALVVELNVVYRQVIYMYSKKQIPYRVHLPSGGWWENRGDHKELQKRMYEHIDSFGGFGFCTAMDCAICGLLFYQWDPVDRNNHTLDGSIHSQIKQILTTEIPFIYNKIQLKQQQKQQQTTNHTNGNNITNIPSIQSMDPLPLGVVGGRANWFINSQCSPPDSYSLLPLTHDQQLFSTVRGLQIYAQLHFH